MEKLDYEILRFVTNGEMFVIDIFIVGWIAQNLIDCNSLGKNELKRTFFSLKS